mmetsp:Transcript_15220/g.44785  ORF Transcript_15220/g.44785 Transcript_15220/m.44785 type:complete len:314 (+) Transcript_15220:3366-4307(+)
MLRLPDCRNCSLSTGKMAQPGWPLSHQERAACGCMRCTSSRCTGTRSAIIVASILASPPSMRVCTSATGRSSSTLPRRHENRRPISVARRSAYHTRMSESPLTARIAWSRASSHFSRDSFSTCCSRCRRWPSSSARSERCLKSPTFWMVLSSPTSISMPTCMPAMAMSCSLRTVSLPMCSSLDTWSSREGISTFPAVRVRRVATTKPSEMACRMRSFARPLGSSARTSSRNGGLRPERIASLESDTCSSGSDTLLPRGIGRMTLPCESLMPPVPHTSSGVFFFLLSIRAHASSSSSGSVPPSMMRPPSRNLLS